MSLLNRFTEYIQQHHLFLPKDKLLLAVSGGVDSVVLCELCRQAGYDFIIAHCNFQLRGKESERDEEFVKRLGAKYGAVVCVKKFDTGNYSAQHAISIQEAARTLRYTWFKELINNSPGEMNLPPDGLPRYLLTAHHADDNIETLLMNFFRGTGLHGLTGIPLKTGYIRRPLLSFTKEELLHFAQNNKLQWVEDTSNESSKYTRNYFRNELIPALQKVFPQVKQNLYDNINRFQEIESLYRLSLNAVIKKLVRKKGNESHVPVQQLMAFANRALIYEIIAGAGFTEKQIDEVIKLAGSESGRYILSPDKNYRLIKHRHWFIISPVVSAGTDHIVIEEWEKQVQFANGEMKIKKMTVDECTLPGVASTACFDSKRISFPLILRKWKTGDYFYPLGLKKPVSGKPGKKKVARFLIDQKLSTTAKEKVWVVESNKRIIWVVGYRTDERFKITPHTKQVLQLQVI